MKKAGESFPPSRLTLSGDGEDHLKICKYTLICITQVKKFNIIVVLN